MSYVSVGSASGPIIEFVEEWGMENLEDYSPSTAPNSTKVFVNGVWLGVHRDPAHLVQTLRDLRRKVKIPLSAVPIFVFVSLAFWFGGLMG
jgi:DNA-directed RNA polymerase II subunit RPB2